MSDDSERVVPVVIQGLRYPVRSSLDPVYVAELAAYVDDAEERGVRIFIGAAGMAAHLPGVLASLTARPVIGVPLDSGALGGADALYSVVQMPPGVPVAAVAIGSAGARNAAHLAARILALGDLALAARVEAVREKLAGGAELAIDPR